MEMHEMVIRVLKTLAAGNVSDQGIVAINWKVWATDKTDCIRCVIHSDDNGDVECLVYPAVGTSEGVDLRTGASWTVDDKVLFS